MISSGVKTWSAGSHKLSASGYPSPFDQVLKLLSSPMEAVINDGLHFKLLFTFDQVRWGSCVIRPVLLRFLIRGQQTGVKHVMDGPGQGECQFISDR